MTHRCVKVTTLTAAYDALKRRGSCFKNLYHLRSCSELLRFAFSLNQSFITAPPTPAAPPPPYCPSLYLSDIRPSLHPRARSILYRAPVFHTGLFVPLSARPTSVKPLCAPNSHESDSPPPSEDDVAWGTSVDLVLRQRSEEEP